MNWQKRVDDAHLDMTQTELIEDDDFDAEEEFVSDDDFRDHIDDLHDMFEVYACAIMLARMFEDDLITLGQYIELTEYVEGCERDLDVTL